MIHRWLGPHAAAANAKNINVCWNRHATLFKLLLLSCRRTKPNRKMANLIQTISRSGGRISGRTKFFLPRAQDFKPLCFPNLCRGKKIRFFPTMRWVIGVALVPRFALIG